MSRLPDVPMEGQLSSALADAVRTLSALESYEAGGETGFDITWQDGNVRNNATAVLRMKHAVSVIVESSLSDLFQEAIRRAREDVYTARMALQEFYYPPPAQNSDAAFAVLAERGAVEEGSGIGDGSSLPWNQPSASIVENGQLHYLDDYGQAVSADAPSTDQVHTPTVRADWDDDDGVDEYLATFSSPAAPAVDTGLPDGWILNKGEVPWGPVDVMTNAGDIYYDQVPHGWGWLVGLEPYLIKAYRPAVAPPTAGETTGQDAPAPAQEPEIG